MALSTPTTKSISDNIIAQLEASLNQTIPLLPKSFLRVLAKVLAGVFILLYKYAGFMFLQTFVRTASISETVINGLTVSPLIEWGRLIGVGDPAPATSAQLRVEITVDSEIGNIPSGTQLLGLANGVTYITLTSVFLDESTKEVEIVAVGNQNDGDGSGVIGNLNPGQTVNFVNPLPYVARGTTVVSQTVTGADGESEAAYRQRVLDRFQKRPQGGALADYELWGEEPAGILNVYPYTSDCPGQVDVYVEATAASSGNADGIPTAAQLQIVLDSIDLDDDGLASRRPANALVNTFPITRIPFDVTVNGLSVDDAATVQGLIEDAVTEYLFEREPFIVGLSVNPRKDRVVGSSIACIVEDIAAARNGIFTSVVVSESAVPIEIYSLGIGEKAKLGTITFVP